MQEEEDLVKIDKPFSPSPLVQETGESRTPSPVLAHPHHPQQALEDEDDDLVFMSPKSPGRQALSTLLEEEPEDGGLPMLLKMALYSQQQIAFQQELKKKRRRERELVALLELSSIQEELSVANQRKFSAIEKSLEASLDLLKRVKKQRIHIQEQVKPFLVIIEQKFKEELCYAFRSESVNKLKVLLQLLQKFTKETTLLAAPLLIDSILMTQGSVVKPGQRVSTGGGNYAPPQNITSANGSFAMNSGRREIVVNNALSGRANTAIVPGFGSLSHGLHSHGSTGALGSSRLLVDTGDNAVAELIAKQISFSQSKSKAESALSLRDQIIYGFKGVTTFPYQLFQTHIIRPLVEPVDQMLEFRRKKLHFAGLQTSSHPTDTEKQEEKEEQMRLQARYTRMHGPDKQLQAIAELRQSKSRSLQIRRKENEDFLRYRQFQQAISWNTPDAARSIINRGLHKHFQTLLAILPFFTVASESADTFSFSKRVDMSVRLYNLLVSGAESLSSRILPQMQTVSYTIEHYQLLVCSFTYITAILRALPMLDKIYERAEINANQALLKLLIDWEALQVDLRDVRVRVANCLKKFGGDLVRNEAMKLLKRNRELYNPLELIDGGTGPIQKLGAMFLQLPEGLQLVSSEELAEAYKESAGLSVSILLQEVMGLVASLKMRVSQRGAEQMQQDLKYLLRVGQVERSLGMVQKWEKMADFLGGRGQDAPFLRAFRGLRVKE